MGEERFYLGRKDKTACVFVVKQRLHADSVTGKKELFFLFLPHGKGVYSVELVEAGLAPGDVCPEQYLRVAGGGERNARRFKLRADFGGVVKLAVIDDSVAVEGGFTGHRLGASGGVYDAKAAVGEGAVIICVEAAVVGASRNHCLSHSTHYCGAVAQPAAIYPTCYSTH